MTVGINPTSMDAVTWANRTVGILTQYGVRQQLLRAEDWKAWAIYVNRIMSKYKGQMPDPRGYADWRAWAQRFTGAISS